jgi:LysR family glycine cleavage system transcriptional activator
MDARSTESLGKVQRPAQRPSGGGAKMHDDLGALDLDDLRCFLAAARQLSFRRAAREVALSPAAFSDRVHRLEERLGAALFTRTTRHVALTPAGERLLPRARRLLDELADLPALVRDDGRPPPLTLTMGTRFELGNSWLLPALCALRADHPERTIHLRYGDSAALLDELDGGTIDAVVTSFRLGRPRLDYATLHEEHYVLVAAPALLAARPLRSAADAAEHQLIDAHEDLPLFRYLLDALPSRTAWSFRSTWLLGAIGAIRDRVLAGDGVAVLPCYLVEPDLATGALVAPLPEISPRSDWFRLVWRAGDRRAPQLGALAEALLRFPLR